MIFLEFGIPHKVKSFLRLVTQGNFFTNKQRYIRKIADNAKRNYCDVVCEDINHFFRKC